MNSRLIYPYLKLSLKSIFTKDKDVKKIKILYRTLSLFDNKEGLEIGGPSPVFRRRNWMPVYKVMKSCDGVNFSHSTVWTGDINENSGYVISGKVMGKQYIADATDLSLLPDEKYDFVLSSNNIEHIANPMKAVKEWLRVLKKGGILVVVAPRKESNFDHKRSIVNFEHLVEDFNLGTTEEDLTHLEEILKLHDLDMDKPAGTLDQFRERSLKNIENRCLHQHVFDDKVLIQIYDYFGVTVIENLTFYSDYIVIGRK